VLTPSEIAILRKSWLTVAAQADAAGEAFYDMLFEAAPQLRPLFRTSQRLQARKLMDTLATVVDTIDDFATLVPLVEQLGRRHVEFGAEAAHYDTVGQVLIKTLRRFGGPAFDAEAEAVWIKAYGIVSGTMISAARGARSSPAA